MPENLFFFTTTQLSEDDAQTLPDIPTSRRIQVASIQRAMFVYCRMTNENGATRFVQTESRGVQHDDIRHQTQNGDCTLFKRRDKTAEYIDAIMT